jgi:DNA (cytosine-5)-methyltransferase 1
MRILNLFAGIGGNRLLWGDNHEITAVELNPDIAAEYQRRFPKDTVIVANAFDYLIENFHKWDLIWASPPCQSHTKMMKGTRHNVLKYPDFRLWEVITVLQHFSKCKWIVENVIPYYTPLIAPTIQISRHLFWCNFYVSKIETKFEKIQGQDGNKRFGISLENVKINHRKDQLLKNLVDPEIGLHFLNRAFDIVENSKVKQQTLF